MSKKTFTAAICLLLTAAMLIPAVAWFADALTAVFPNMSASTYVSYFASGDGSAEDPYVIRDKVHLYNLAWLQYIGYFNKGPANNGRTQSHFKLHDDLKTAGLDMNGWTLPPIGTTQYPFLGVFDGNSCVIKNLTTANADDAFTQRPANAEFEVNQLLSTYLPSGTSAQVGHVMGLFGVVGDYGGAAATVGQSDTETGAITIKNFGMYNCTVADSSTATVAGLVAGYANAKVSGVVVSDCTLDVKTTASAPTGDSNISTTNVSDFTLIGYCTSENYVNENSVVVYTPSTSEAVKEPGGSGDGQESNWGGSIAMDNLYSNLKGAESGVALQDYAHSATKIQGATNTSSYFVVDRVLSTAGNVRVSSGDRTQFSLVYTLPDVSSSSLPAGGAKIMPMVFEKATGQTVNVNTVMVGDQYLNMTFAANGMPQLQLGATATTNWGFSGSGNTGNLFAISDDYKIYVNVENNDIVFSSTGTTTWGFDAGESGGLYYTSSGTKYYLKYNGERWVLEQAVASGAAYYYIHSGDNYLSLTDNKHPDPNSGAYYLGTATIDTASTWHIDSKTEGGYTYYVVYTVKDGINYYLAKQDKLIGTPHENVTFWNYIQVGDEYVIKHFWENIYLSYNSSGEWILTDSSNTNVTIEAVDLGGSTGAWSCASNGTVTNITVASNGDPLQEFGVANTNDATYIPLQMGEDADGNCTYLPTNLNTGYITSGYYDELFKSSFQDISRGTGDIRVAQYYTSCIVRDSDNVERVFVWNGTGFEKLSLSTTKPADTTLDLKKYWSTEVDGKTVDGSVAAYYNLLHPESGNALYGLHFMDASININSLVTIPTAKINGVTYTNYQVPGDCIDFHLKEAGYINFFAGAYFPGTDCFFSLHHIKRDANQKIIEIKEIQKIYGKAGLEQYVYEYTDGTVSAESVPNDYSVIFDTSCLTDPTNPLGVGGNSGKLNNQSETDIGGDLGKAKGDGYYFEIPVNAGEYALGSVEGGTGAYLLYLDIGTAPNATAGDIWRTVTTEAFAETQHTYADGVAVLAGQSYPETFPADQHVALALPNGSSGTVILSEAEGKITLGGTAAAGAALRAELGADVLNKEIASTITKRVTVTYTDVSGNVLASATVTKKGNEDPTVTAGTATLADDGVTLSLVAGGRAVSYTVDWSAVSIPDTTVVTYRYTATGTVTNEWAYTKAANADKGSYAIRVYNDGDSIEVTVEGTVNSAYTVTFNGSSP